ncbi:MAG: type I restriction-modification system endonuclease [Candidatus Wallbacteria bacterium HGW-Wallbacteria-1]|jgi:type I restriction enzyme R subunit|uniref:Type I restriction-modification system endonuclease n=1 Tax=Candidatus Wallbacteria bacterium HGW-Wallbacteria-1 TaxID=2013854 RepID=A0A2N1PJG8_9BACT|nr:MAG: type I restriction-modification system endonuclease [Candidatus Wallbacteria bacterium HGW-Wallbacteria-1]
MISPNFEFLSSHDPLLAKTAAQAERYLFTDPNASMYKSRALCELMASRAGAISGLRKMEFASQMEFLRDLRENGIVPQQVYQLFNEVRKSGNKAVHEMADSQGTAFYLLKMARQIAVWFHKTFENDPGFSAGPFVAPPNPAHAHEKLREELERLRQENEEFNQRLNNFKLTADQQARLREEADQKAKMAYEELTVALDLAQESEIRLEEERRDFEIRLSELASQSTPALQSQIRELSQNAAEEMDLSEWDTRKLIDSQLNEVGWEADTENLCFGKGVRPQKNRNLAIAEWPTSSGPADYVLFAGLTPLAVVEAKRKSRDVPGAIEQAKRYSRNYIVRADEIMPGEAWRDYKIPFMFATNGRPFLRQIQTKSGIWFLDGRLAHNHPRPLDDWYRPEGLLELLRSDVSRAESLLRVEPTDYLGLRDYQIEAIRGVEKALGNGQREMLLAMATGTGKTRTCLGIVYRLIKSRRFTRVLFLVDRSALGTQATEVFKTVKLENLQSFEDIYDIKEMGDLKPEADTKLHVATIQGMMRRLLSSDEDRNGDSDRIFVDQYDCIVVDECHRGYNLDKEMTEGELFFRSEQDYVSKYRRVIDHFDAVKIGLTATPAIHTTEIFGKPVYEYSYRQAVIDGYLVDHDPPLRIVTHLAEEGMTWEQGAKVQIYNPKTGKVDLSDAPDEIHVDIDRFNTQVITENFNRVVCQELARHIDPAAPGKTLIFCATDSHADLVVTLLKEALSERWNGIDDNAVVKITGSADRPGELIRRFKNEKYPALAVTVDLLTTGIDVPAIDKLVFIRRVKSRILYEQMLGRATRLCEEIEKERFQIFDAVDLYSSIEDHNTMRPVIQSPSTSFRQLTELIFKAGDSEYREDLRDQMAAKLQRKRRLFTDREGDSFSLATGFNPTEFAHRVKEMTGQELSDWLTNNSEIPEYLDSIRKGGGPGQLISTHDDHIVDVCRGYGDNQQPGDYIESFRKYIKEHINEVPALLMVTQRPRDLSRAELKSLLLTLAKAGFPELNIQEAWRDWKNEYIAARIIGFIRHLALGSPLIPYEERIGRTMGKILGAGNWTREQEKWLKRFGKQLGAETVIDRDTLNQGQFAQDGGFDRLNRIFDGRLEHVLGEIREELWADATTSKTSETATTINTAARSRENG